MYAQSLPVARVQMWKAGDVSLPGAEYDIASLFRVSILKLFCDQSMREKAWRSRKRGAKAM